MREKRTLKDEFIKSNMRLIGVLETEEMEGRKLSNKLQENL